MDFIIGAVFWVLAAVVLFSALMVVISKNLIHGALWLIASFAGVAGFYFLLEAPFIGVVQILVYTGAVSILMLFAIMLTRHVTGEGERHLFERWWVAAVVAVVLFAAVLVPAIWSPQLPAPPGQPTYWPQADPVQVTAQAQAEEVAQGAEEAVPAEQLEPSVAGVLEIGLSFMGEYYLPFWVAGVLLIAAFIGAVVIAYEERTTRRRILTLAEEAELRRSVSGLGIDRPQEVSAPVPWDRSDAGTAERR
jgi:NADH-quinone oxidoreductase subunit J